mgnify:CR=1 FL=1
MKKQIEVKLYDPLTESITEIANQLLHKEHPDISIESWQTKYVLMACQEFVKEYEKLEGEK